MKLIRGLVLVALLALGATAALGGCGLQDQAIENTSYFSAIHLAASEAEADELLQRGEVQFVITIPGDFTRRIMRGEVAQITVEADATDPAKANPDVAANTGFAAAPTIGGGTIPGAALWWDGFTIAKNISDEDAAASFQAMVKGISPETVAANPTAATWLVAGFQPGPTAVGVIGNATGGARAYPMQPYMGLLHTALSAELADFIAGKEDAD